MNFCRAIGFTEPMLKFRVGGDGGGVGIKGGEEGGGEGGNEGMEAGHIRMERERGDGWWTGTVV